MQLEYVQVDAFSSTPLLGNPCAVFFDADDVDTDTMQAIARETNLSETVFFQRPTDASASYKVRIFTPRLELPFAGHPTIASAHAFLERGGSVPSGASPVLMQECGVGLVPVEVDDSGAARRLTMTQAPPTFEPVPLDADQVARIAGCERSALGPQAALKVSTGIPWLVVEIADHRVLASLNPDSAAFARFNDDTGLVGLALFALGSDQNDCDVKVRAFARGAGVPEDPVTGSANGCITAYIVRNERLGPGDVRYVAEQGAELQRDGRVYAEGSRQADAIEVRIGGEAVTVARGVLTLR